MVRMRGALLPPGLLLASLIGLVTPAAAEAGCTTPMPVGSGPYLVDCGVNLGLVGTGTTVAEDCFNVRFLVFREFFVVGDDPCPA